MVERAYLMVVRPLSEEEGGGFVAFTPDLTGCMGDGETPEAAVTDLTNAIAEWMDEAERLGLPIPQPGYSYEEAMKEEAEIMKLIEGQERLLAEQDRSLDAARAELARTKAALDVLREREADAHHGYSTRWGASPALMNAAVRKRRPTRLAN